MPIERKTEWLQKKANLGEQGVMLRVFDDLNLNTVCQQALCPNISECFGGGQATFLILGTLCTRLCSFCSLENQEPLPIDSEEPVRIAVAVARLELVHVVITSPTRDDLPDGGAGVYAEVVAAIRSVSPGTRIEVLIPDMQGKRTSLETVTAFQPHIIGHNIETVPRLYHIRSGADYRRSLDVLDMCGALSPGIKTKSGMMLGMGEREDELLQVLSDLRDVGCDYVSLGQYLAPSRAHYPVQEYILPETFESLRGIALEMGFSHVESGPYVRSTYNATAYK